jgi:hypothetical protein
MRHSPNVCRGYVHSFGVCFHGSAFFCVAPTVTPHGARSTVNWGLAFEVVLVTFGPLLVKQQWKEIDTGCWG